MSSLEDIPTRITLLEKNHDDFKGAIYELKELNREISHSLNRLIVLEERHGETRESLKRAFNAIELNGNRLTLVERDMPQLNEMKTLINKAVFGILSVVALAILGLVMKVV